jgi:formylmethanofuran dehydrogenase subunit E
MCPLAVLPVPKKLERQLGIFKWENAENYMREHPEVKEMIVQSIPNEHLYKLVREGDDLLVRVHYDRVCTGCGELFVHTDERPRFFVCPDCLKKK